MNSEMTVALVTFIPKERIPPSDLDKHNFALPESHEITCELIDTRTGRRLASVAARINALPITNAISLRHAPFVKELLLVRTQQIPRGANLAIRVNYELGGKPLDREMLVLVINEAPLL